MTIAGYKELIDELAMFSRDPRIARARKAIRDLLTMHQLDQAEIVRLRRQIEVLQMEGEK